MKEIDMAVIVPVNLDKPWVDQWPDPRVRADLMQALMSLSIDVVSARAWMFSIFAVGSTPATLLEVAKEWSSVGLPASDALMWAESGCCFPMEAVDWHVRGFTAKEVEFSTNVIGFNRRGHTFDSANAEAAAWRRSGLTPRLVLLGVANDEPLEVMLKKAAEGKMTESVQGTMRLLAGLCGVDVQALRIDWATLARTRRAARLEEGWR
jgi:hypothetical protein